MKKAEMGIGTLIIFIALLLVAAVAAGVLIQTSGSLQEKALMTGDQARSQIATNLEVVEVSATDGRLGSVKEFTQIVKLAPGSDPIKMTEMILTMNTYQNTLTVTYAGTSATTTNSAGGYYSWDVETVQIGSFTGNDYNLDSVLEQVTGGLSQGKIYLNVSGIADGINIGYCDTGVFNKELTNFTFIRDASATCNGDDATTATLTPALAGKGVFAVEYLQMGSNFVAGNIQRGDVAKIYYEAPEQIGEGVQVRINIIPKIGTPTLTEFITPEVISTERVYLYP